MVGGCGGYESPDDYDYENENEDQVMEGQTLDGDQSKTYRTSHTSKRTKQKADPYTLHINSLQRSVKHYNRVLKKLKQKIKDA